MSRKLGTIMDFIVNVEGQIYIDDSNTRGSILRLRYIIKALSDRLVNSIYQHCQPIIPYPDIQSMWIWVQLQPRLIVLISDLLSKNFVFFIRIVYEVALTILYSEQSAKKSLQMPEDQQ